MKCDKTHFSVTQLLQRSDNKIIRLVPRQFWSICQVVISPTTDVPLLYPSYFIPGHENKVHFIFVYISSVLYV